MALGVVDADAAKLADVLLHSCHARASAAGTDADPHWVCATCGSRMEISYPLHLGNWHHAVAMKNLWSWGR